MRIWLDDKRKMPFGYDVWVTNAQTCINLVSSLRIDFISFDHDLGGILTGYDVANYIEKLAHDNILKHKIPWECHSSNPVGSKRINQAMTNAEKWIDINRNLNITESKKNEHR